MRELNKADLDNWITGHYGEDQFSKYDLDEREREDEPMSEHDALLAIQELLDGVEWTPETLNEIARVMERTGFHIADIKEEDEKAEERRREGDRGR